MKPDVELISPYSQLNVGRVMGMGKKKYGERDWENGLPFTKLLASAERHLLAIKSGEDIDEESGMLHVDLLQARVMMLSHMYRTNPQMDDRPARFRKPKRIGTDIDGVLANFREHFFEYIGVEKPRHINWNDPTIRKRFDEIALDEQFWLTQPALASYDDLRFEPAAYVTHRPIPNEITEKWLFDINNFPYAPVINVYNTDLSKSDVCCNEDIEIFVDDRYKYYEEINSSGVFCYLMDAAHNKKFDVGARRIYHISDIDPFGGVDYYKMREKYGNVG